jgi:chitosanase
VLVRVPPLTPSPPIAERASLKGAEKRRAEQLTSLFENNTLEPQYGYAENLHDGRGITAGRAGFTSGTDDLLEVVLAYLAKKPHAPLARYLPTLERLHKLPDDSSKRASTRGLEGFAAAWAEASRDPAMHAAQDAIVDKLFFRPAERHCDALCLRTPLARAQVYDAIIQHGEGDSADGLGELIRHSNTAAGGTPAQGVDERHWLSAFLKVRRHALLHAQDPATRREWARSVDRVGVFEDLLREGNLQLEGPLHVHHGDFEAVIP